jgi:hypothetical protein
LPAIPDNVDVVEADCDEVVGLGDAMCLEADGHRMQSGGISGLLTTNIVNEKKMLRAVFGMPSRRWIGHGKIAMRNKHKTRLSHGFGEATAQIKLLLK